MANFVEGHQTSPINITTQRKKQPSKNYKSTSNYHYYFLITIIVLILNLQRESIAESNEN